MSSDFNCKSGPEVIKLLKAELFSLTFCKVLLQRHHEISCYTESSPKTQKTGPEIKKLFMLNSSEHEIYPAHKC